MPVILLIFVFNPTGNDRIIDCHTGASYLKVKPHATHFHCETLQLTLLIRTVRGPGLQSLDTEPDTHLRKVSINSCTSEQLHVNPTPLSVSFTILPSSLRDSCIWCPVVHLELLTWSLGMAIIWSMWIMDF